MPLLAPILGQERRHPQGEPGLLLHSGIWDKAPSLLELQSQPWRQTSCLCGLNVLVTGWRSFPALKDN